MLYLLTAFLAAAPSSGPLAPVDAPVTVRAAEIETIHPDADLKRVAADQRVLVQPANAAQSRPSGVAGFGGGGPFTFLFSGDDPEGDAPSGAAYTPDGSTIVVAHRESRNLILWDAVTKAFIADIPLSGAPQGIAISPDGQTAVVGLLDVEGVSIVDLAGLSETTVVPLAGKSTGARILDAGDLAGVARPFDSAIDVIDLGTSTVIRTIEDINFSQTLSFSPEPPAVSVSYSEFEVIDADRVINADAFLDEAQLIDLRTGDVIRLPLADNPRTVAVSADRTRAAIAHTSSTQLISVIDTATSSVEFTVNTPQNLTGPIALNPDGSKAAVGIQNASLIVTLDTGVSSPSINTASGSQMLTTADGQYALLVGFRGALLSYATESLVLETNNAVSTSLGAVSPTAPQAALFSTTFGDDMVVVNTNGGAGGLETFQLSGPIEEGDRCRTVAITPNGQRALGVSIFSDNVAIADISGASVENRAPVGQRPSAIAVSPDGSTAVVGNLDSTFATVIDIASGTSTDVPISRRAGSAAISPDGQFAYLGVVADGDGVWRINLDTNTVQGPKLLTGNMGGVGYSYSQTSEIELSPDGTLLAVAGSFTDNVTFVDAVNWSVITSTPTPGFPTILEYSPDGSRLYVACRNADVVREIDTATFNVVRTLNVGDQPWHLAATDDTLYVHNWGGQNIQRIDLFSGLVTNTRNLVQTAAAVALDDVGGRVLVGRGAFTTTVGGDVGFEQTQDGTLEILDALDLTLIEALSIGKAPSAIAVSASGGTAALAAPNGDGLVLVDLGGEKTKCVGDFSGDGEVGPDDLATLLAQWGGPGDADLDESGDVGAPDLAILLAAWGDCP